jgi:uroporphyrinogen III methyltransferase / synthase
MINVLVSPHDSDRELAATLARSGARVSVWPPVEIDALADDSSLHEAIENLFGYDWLILKNVYAAEYFLRAFLTKHHAGEMDDLRVLTVGPETAEKLAAYQMHVDIALDRFSHGQVYGEIERYVGQNSLLARQNLLVPSAAVVIESFEDQFANAGARVDPVAAYQTCSDKRQLIKLRTLLAGGGIDFVVFTSASAIAEFAALFDTDDPGRALNSVRVACLDRLTSDLAGKYGLLEILTPVERSIPMLVEIITSTSC